MKYFDYETRVRYGETDCMGVSYYANYFVWFEVARTEYFCALGFAYSEFEKQGILLPAVEAHARYLAPSVYDDLLTIRAAVSRMRQSSLCFEYQVLKDKTARPLAAGYTVHVFSNRELKPIRIPEILKSKVEIVSLIESASARPLSI